MTDRIDTVVIGGGQAGLAVGYHLTRVGVPFVILDAGEEVGDAWRKRWDSLRLFSPARYSGLPGMAFPAPGDHYPTKDEMADFLVSYAEEFDLPVRTGVRVQSLDRVGDQFTVDAEGLRFEANNVVVAMATHQEPRIPGFSTQLDEGITQLHTATYVRPSQLQPGPVLVVGAGNSGAEISLDIAEHHETFLSGNHPGHVPIDIDSTLAHRIVIPLIFRFIGHHVLTVDTPVGRKMRPKILEHGSPLIRTKPKDIEAAGITQLPRVKGVERGLPVLEDGMTVEVSNVIWCTGFRPSFDWIDIPIIESGAMEPNHYRGVVEGIAGLYFVGLMFLYSMTSGFIRGVGRDAAHIVEHITARAATPDPKTEWR